MLGTHVHSDGSIEFWFHYRDTDQAFVSGNFNDWDLWPLEPADEGWWRLRTDALPEGDYFYKFVAQGGWVLDQFNFRRSLDGENSYVHVGGACGHLLRRSFFSHALGREKQVVAYLPPSYPYDTDRQYPSLVLLPGLLDDETTWSRQTGLEDVMDRLVGERSIPEMVILMPDKDDTMFHEETWGAFGQYIHEDMRLHAEVEYRLRADGAYRGIEGLSLGGAWALRLASWQPELYASIGGLSCAFSEELAGTLRWSAPRLAERGVRVRLACGDGEGQALYDATMTFGNFLQNLGIAVECCVDHGPHDWPLWRLQLPHSLAFHGWTFRAHGA